MPTPNRTPSPPSSKMPQSSAQQSALTASSSTDRCRPLSAVEAPGFCWPPLEAARMDSRSTPCSSTSRSSSSQGKMSSAQWAMSAPVIGPAAIARGAPTTGPASASGRRKSQEEGSSISSLIRALADMVATSMRQPGAPSKRSGKTTSAGTDSGVRGEGQAASCACASSNRQVARAAQADGVEGRGENTVLVFFALPLSGAPSCTLFSPLVRRYFCCWSSTAAIT